MPTETKMASARAKFPGRPVAKNGQLKARQPSRNLVKSKNGVAAKKSLKERSKVLSAPMDDTNHVSALFYSNYLIKYLEWFYL